MKTLSDVPSEMMEQALADLEIVEKSPLYVVNMGSWHEQHGRVCEVCLAGASMAVRYGISPDESHTPSTVGGIGSKTRNKLYAIDQFRCGFLWDAMVALELKSPFNDSDDMNVVDYHQDPVAFKRDIHRVIARLKETGL